MATYYIAFESVVKTVQADSVAATAANKMHARAYRLLFVAIDDVDVHRFVWMPAHQRVGRAGFKSLSDGTVLTTEDIRGNDRADVLAKRGVEEHGVSKTSLKELHVRKAEAKNRAVWLAEVTQAANNMGSFPHRDAEGSRQKANMDADKRKLQGKVSEKGKTRIRKDDRPVQLGGHTLQPTGAGLRTAWRCSCCKPSSASWPKLAQQMCKGSAVSRWADEAARRASAGVAIGNGHSTVLSGELAWCIECGNYANVKSFGPSKPCKGAPNMRSNGGMAGQLKKLQRGRHLRTGTLLPTFVDEKGVVW